jgi:UDP-N-acetylmuramyl tripeptide synthase
VRIALIPIVFVGKLLRLAARLRGGGSAFPGWVVLKLMPDFIARATAQLEHGVVVVLGSNGKSTTTNMVAGIVAAHGSRVFTNPTGANMPQGVASSLLSQLTLSGRLPYDIGVVEVDEAYGEVICAALRPRAGVILNVQIDQIYRLFEPDRVASMFERIATHINGTIVLNRDDPFLAALGDRLAQTQTQTQTPTPGHDVRWFAVAPEVLVAAPHGQVLARNYAAESTASDPAAHDSARLRGRTPVITEVTSAKGRAMGYRWRDHHSSVQLSARGLHNAVDAVAAITLSEAALGSGFVIDTAERALSSLKTAYGRGELITVGDRTVEIVLMKSLASLQMNLDAFESPPDSVVMAFDEHSRDPSWLYAADLSIVHHVAYVSGPKAVFLALRLLYAGVTYDQLNTDVVRAVQHVLDGPRPPTGVHTLILDYDQMIIVRRFLGYRDLEAGAA